MSIQSSSARPLRVLITVGIGVALAQIGTATLYIVLPIQTAQTGVALGIVGVLLGVNQLVAVLLNGPVGIAYDRWPRRWLFIAALFFSALSSLFIAMTWGATPLLFSRILAGVAWATITIGGPLLILDVAPPESRGRWMGYYRIWPFLGMAIGSIIAGILADRFGFHTTMMIVAALAALGALPALFFLPETKKPAP